jgi:hypothetical protein
MPNPEFMMSPEKPKTLNQSYPLNVPALQKGNTTFDVPNMKDFQALMYHNQNNLNSFDGGINYAHYQNPPQLANQFQFTTGGIIQSVKQSGRLKFFDEVQNYGFLVVDGDDSDLFVHYDDLKTSRLSRDILRQAKTNYFLQFSFDIAYYSGKYKESRKAVNLKLIKMEKLGLIN